GERHGRGDGDGVAGMHAHRVDVLDRADDDHVVAGVAHQLQLELLPAEDALLEQDLVGRARVQPGPGDAPQVLLIPGDAGPGPAEGERGPYHHGVAKSRLPAAHGCPGTRGGLPGTRYSGEAFVHVVADIAGRDLGAQPCHDLLEPLAVL